MNSDKLTNAEIRALGWQALVEKLGPSGALRFAMQTERGHGDYSELRHEMLGALSVDDLLSRMRASKPNATRKSRKKAAPATPAVGVSTPQRRRAGRR